MTQNGTAEKAALLRDRKTGTPLPLEGVSVEAEIVEGSVRTVVSQRFTNEGSKPVEAVYVFPLEEGSAVSAFEAVVEGRVIRGKVEDRERAFEIYDDAMEKGHGAYLLDEERPDVFTLSVGNLPPKGEAVIRITTVAEVPREGDGLRWVLPTTVSPRYAPAEDHKGVGRTSAEAVNPPVAFSVPYGLELTVTVEMASDIRAVESPSHPISVETDGRRAVVRLGERRTALDRDFVLVVRAAEAEVPRVVVEKGAEGGGAVKLVFPPLAAEGSSPAEVLFLVDRSGSMGGTSIDEARNALQLAVRSLPEGLHFNIAGFGSGFEALFKKSRPFGDKTLAEADKWIEGMDADLGGTEILPALTRLLSGETPSGGRALFVLTDGQVSNTDAVIGLVSIHAAGTRVFTFGIGAGASLALVRGMARAGRGACELIAPGERIEAKVVRQLARALKGGLGEAVIDWGGLAVRQAPGRLGTVFAGEPTIVYALVDHLKPATVTLTAQSAAGSVSTSARIEATGARCGTLVATLAARGLIRDLEEGEYARAGSRQRDRKQDDTKERIVAIAKAFGLASRETSFVAVEERKDPVTGEAELVRIPVALTRGWGAVREATGAFSLANVHSTMAPAAAPPARAAALSGVFERAFVSSVSALGGRLRAARAKAPRLTAAPRFLDTLVRLQRADGSWNLDKALAEAIGRKLGDLEKQILAGGKPVDLVRRAFATALALAFLDLRCAENIVEWKLLAEKARAWLKSLPASISPKSLESLASEVARAEARR